jgi:alpha-N-acetylglucosamine transferase
MFSTDCDKSTLIVELAVTDTNGQFQTVRRYYNADCGQTQRVVKNLTKGKEERASIIKRTYPNPLNSTAQVELNLLNAENLRVDIIDATGNVRKRVFNGYLPKGSRTLTINTTSLQSGTYQLRVVAKDRTEYQQLIVIK